MSRPPCGAAAQPLLPLRQKFRPSQINHLHTVLTNKVYRGSFVGRVQALGWQQQVGSHPFSLECGFVVVAKSWGLGVNCGKAKERRK